MTTENDSLANFATASLTSAMHRLMLDPDLADLTVTCGDKEWKVHSNILAARSPFFKAAVTNNMVEKLEMKIDIKEFDPNVMEEVLNFMYGVPKGNGTVQFLFEAAERFQMEDLKEYAVKFARKEMTVENVVELGHAAELYSIDDFLAQCAKFIVKNDVPLSGEDTSPKLAVMVVSILKDANQNLNNANEELKGKLQDCENKLKADAEWRRLTNIHLNGQHLKYVGSGNVGSALAKKPLSTSSHYFEMEIIDPGPRCEIAIGLSRKDYTSRDSYPGFNKGSIGYHADDGKVYTGTEVGFPFGPRSNKGDIMGCGVLFPSDYECKSDSEDEQEVNTDYGKMVCVYFTRNGKAIWNKEVVLPKGGFFPIVAINRSQAKVRVDLKPDCK